MDQERVKELQAKVEAEFRGKLAALLAEYGAEIMVDDHYSGYPECGRDLRATVSIPAVWDKDGETIRPFVEFDLGTYIH